MKSKDFFDRRGICEICAYYNTHTYLSFPQPNKCFLSDWGLDCRMKLLFNSVLPDVVTRVKYLGFLKSQYLVYPDCSFSIDYIYISKLLDVGAEV